MALVFTKTWRFLLILFILQVMMSSSLVTFADASLVIRPMASLRVEADERVKIQALVDTTSPHPLAFVWEQKYGDHLSLRNAMTDTVYFVAPKVATQTDYQLIVLVSDGVTQAHSDVTITVLPYQAKIPLANAGVDQTVHSGDHVKLNGSGSLDEDSLALTYLWAQQSGPQVVFAPTLVETSFIAPQVKELTVLEFQLKVSDETNSSEDNVKVIVVPTPDANIPAQSNIAVSPLSSTTNVQSAVLVEPYSDLNRLTLVQEAYKACFPDSVLSKTKENALIQKLLTENTSPSTEVGITKIEMLRDVLTVCDMDVPLSSVKQPSHYSDIDGDAPEWWNRYAEFSDKHNLFDDQPLFLPAKTMQKSDLSKFLSKITKVKFSLSTIEPSAEVRSPAQPTPLLQPVTDSQVDKSASASVLNKVLAPKFAVFAILFLVGLFCIAYSLLYSLKPARSKNTYISLPNVSPHDRR